MDARSVGLRLVELARANQAAKAVEELLDENIVLIKVMGGAKDKPQIGTGIDAIYEKHAWWESVATVHDIDIEGPFAGNGTIILSYVILSEVGVHMVAKGKIIKEVYLDLVSH